MEPKHQDHHPDDHPSRLTDRAPPDPSASGDLREIDPDRGIKLEALFIAALMMLCAGSTLWSWFG